jgi:hypothetical protein
VVGSGPFRYQDLVSLLGEVPINQDLSLDFTRARIDGDCLDRIIKSCSRLTALSFGDSSLVSGPTNAPLQTLIEYVQRRDSSLSRLSVEGISLNHCRSTMDEWKTLESLAEKMITDTYIESVQLKFK